MEQNERRVMTEQEFRDKELREQGGGGFAADSAARQKEEPYTQPAGYAPSSPIDEGIDTKR